MNDRTEIAVRSRSRSWTDNAIRLIEADARRSADTHLLRYPLPSAALDADAHDDTSRQRFDDGVRAARCPGCGYTYEVDAGNELEGFAAGTAWKDIPDDWCCPDCWVREKVDFVPLSESVA